MRLAVWNLFVLGALTCSNLAAAVPYNEALQPDGEPRPAYRAFFQKYSREPLLPTQGMINKLTQSPLGDKIQILPVPLVLDESEYAVISRGVRQRAQALRSLFLDAVFSASDEEIKSRRLPIPIETLRAIIQDEGFDLDFLRNLWSGRSERSIQFEYGPDLVRNPSGHWVVLEDNIGHIGGPADLTPAYLAYLNAAGIAESETDQFEIMIQKFLQHNYIEQPREQAVAILDGGESGRDCDQQECDLEDERMRETLKRLGIPILSTTDLKQSFFEKLREGRIKVVINLYNPKDWNERHMLAEASKSGLVFYSAFGTEWLGNKSLLPYVDHLVRHYLNEAPVLETQPSRKVTVDQSFEMKTFLDRNRNAVLKKASSSQGRHVLLMNRLSDPSKNANLRHLETLKSWKLMTGETTSLYVVQDYVNPSFLPSNPSLTSWANFLVDLRPISLVLGNRVHTVSRPWGRAISNLSDGISNVSRGAFELPIFVMNCQKILGNLPQ